MEHVTTSPGAETRRKHSYSSVLKEFNTNVHERFPRVQLSNIR